MDDNCSGRASLADSSSLATPSLKSGSSSQYIPNDGLIHVYNYQKADFDKFPPTLNCETICTEMCRILGIYPQSQLLFNIREHGNGKTPAAMLKVRHGWQVAGDELRCDVLYCFRMRFRVPELDTELSALNTTCFTYLYYQMRFDMLYEQIHEIRYPDHKDKVMGLAVIDMLIDKVEHGKSVQAIEKAYKTYVPRSLWQVHRFFSRSKLRSTFRRLSENQSNAPTLKWHYVHQICSLAPSYLTEQFKATVKSLPYESPTVPHVSNGSICSTRTSTTTLATGSSTTLSTTLTGNSNQHSDSVSETSTLRGSSQTVNRKSHRPREEGPIEIPVYVRLWFHDSPEPGLKIAHVTSEASLKWILVASIEDITLISKEGVIMELDIVGLPKPYQMKFATEQEIKSCISYISIYKRLTVEWMNDLCVSYKTPSLMELDKLKCHGPIGGNFSFMKLRTYGDECGSYIVRQCEEEYDTYYIDINTKIARRRDEGFCVTETFKIIHKDAQWRLINEGTETSFDSIPDLAHSIPVDCRERKHIPPSAYEKPPLLMLCLPKNLKNKKKVDCEISEFELSRRNPQILNPKTDLQYYQDTIIDDDRMFTMRGDWIQKGTIKDVPVTMKMIKRNENFVEFFNLAQTWSSIESPLFLKLYGLTLSPPYTMVMQYSEYGPLNKFLQKHNKIRMDCLLDVVIGLARGMNYLKANRILHSYIRCSNMHVTKYVPHKFELVAQIGDPGYPRPYRLSDSPWIPTKYYNNLEAAKEDHATQQWAFATTVYEIFSRCEQPLEQLRQNELLQNRVKEGGILRELPAEVCPAEVYNIIMDGWSEDPYNRFDHQEISACLKMVKKRLLPSYSEILTESEMDANYDTQSTVSTLNGYATSNGAASPSNEVFANSPDFPLVIQLDDCNLVYRTRDRIGSGHYGTVFKGSLEYRNGQSEVVAVKKLERVYIRGDFQREIDIMRRLDHPNVVKFKYWAERSLCIIMEYFQQGSFEDFLEAHPDVKNARLTGFALDIAQGMNYLASQNLIHRDLAARNILVDNTCVKISDFGLAQFVNADGYYYGTSRRDIPIQWYSPEAIATNKFSWRSDVWSYGVTLFEMFSRGQYPFLTDNDITQEEFLNRLLRGERLQQPALCPDFVYKELMLPCWRADPRARPSFLNIITIIQREMGVAVLAGNPQRQQQQQLEQDQQLQEHQQPAEQLPQ